MGKNKTSHVTIKPNEELQKEIDDGTYIIEYSLGGDNWKEYTAAGVKIKKNRSIYIRLANGVKEESENQAKIDTNILIISEKDGLVYLPYKEEDLENYLKTEQYDSREEIIKNVFTTDLSRYKNSVVSRVVEGFKLMREKENASMMKSLEYALSLKFERRLYPAVITACRSRDELDFYLATINENMPELFDSFKIQFDYAPIENKMIKHKNIFQKSKYKNAKHAIT